MIVLACGNPSRGDDALGPEFLAAVEALPRPPGLDIEFVTDFQLQPEHAADLAGRDLALFVDASVAAAAPFRFEVVAPARDRTFSSHAMSPAAVLAACREAFGAAPAAYVLAIRGERFELGEAMGEGARANLRAALAFYARLLAAPTAAAWRAAATPRA
jgi:hydrogenase maturation protease